MRCKVFLIFSLFIVGPCDFFFSSFHAYALTQFYFLLWCSLSAEGQEFFTSYDEVYESFDSMGLQENLLRGIYAYGKYLFASIFSLFVSIFLAISYIIPRVFPLL